MNIPSFLSNRENINIPYGLIGVLAAQNVKTLNFMIFLLFQDFLTFSQKSAFCENEHFYENVEKSSWWDQKEVLEPGATAYFSPRGLKSAKFSTF